MVENIKVTLREHSFIRRYQIEIDDSNCNIKIEGKMIDNREEITSITIGAERHLSLRELKALLAVCFYDKSIYEHIVKEIMSSLMMK